MIQPLARGTLELDSGLLFLIVPIPPLSCIDRSLKSYRYSLFKRREDPARVRKIFQELSQIRIFPRDGSLKFVFSTDCVSCFNNLFIAN